MTEYWDAHCHLADPRWADELDGVIERSREAGIVAWVQGGVCPEDWDRQLALRERFGSGVVPTFGLHPEWVAKRKKEELVPALASLERRLPEAAGLGETGLDDRFGEMALQEWAFERQLEIARAASKPLVLHVVHAHGRALELLRSHGPFPARGIVHLFSGPIEVARDYFQLGFVVSVGGSVTRKGYRPLKAALPAIPFEELVVETDSPDQAPEGAGTRWNEPANLGLIARSIAERTGKTAEAVLERSAATLKGIFGDAQPTEVK